MSSTLSGRDDQPGGQRIAADRIRLRRKELGLTLQEVADLTGVTRSYLSQVETGKLAPSLHMIDRIGAALRIPARVLLEDAAPLASHDDHSGTADAQVSVIRKERRKGLIFPGRPPIDLLTPDLQRKMEVTMTTESTGEWCEVARSRVDTEEFVYVMEGAYEIQLGDDVHRLEREDSMYFCPSPSYRVRSVAEGLSRALWIVLPPAF